METYDVVAGAHPLAYDERLVAWLDGQEGVESRSVPYIRVSEEYTTIALYARDEHGRVRRVTTYKHDGSKTSHLKMAAPVTVSTPDWLWRAVVIAGKGVNRG